MSDQIDFRFQMRKDSPYAALIKYLSPKNKQTEFPRHKMIVWALAAFWHPLACKWLGSFTDEELKQKARDSIYQLQQQIVYLAVAFGLEKEIGSGMLAINPPDFNAKSGFGVSIPSSIVTNPHSKKSDTSLLEVLGTEEDSELLEEAFK